MKGLHLRLVGSLAAVLLLSGATSVAVGYVSPVADAAQAGDIAMLRTLIQNGEDVNAPHGDGMTALHWAAERGDEEMASLLIYAGANLEVGTRIGSYVPLHLASKVGSVEVVRVLLEAGVDARAATTTTGVQPIHLAAESGDPAVIRLIAGYGADVDAREGSEGHTPLSFAAGQNRTEAIRALMALGADPSLQSWTVDVDFRSQVDGEAKARLDEVLQQFRSQEAEEAEDWTPGPEQVQAAIRAARRVQRAGPAEDVEVPRGTVGGWGGLTPLLQAARAGHRDATFTLVAEGADIDGVSAGDGTSPLLIATVNGHFDLAFELLGAGADPNVASEAGVTPLYAAINLEWAPKSRYAQPRSHEFQNTTYLQLMEAFLQEGADPDGQLSKDLWYKWSGRSALGATPFWRASYGTDVTAMRLLVSYGADPSVATTKGPARPRMAPTDTVPSDEPEELDPSGLLPVTEGGPSTYPLHAASGVGYGENYSEGNVHRHAPDGWLPAVRYLVEELGADVNARDQNGYTAVHHAAARGDVALIQYLADHGADVRLISRKGQSTADMANSAGQRLPRHPAAIELLETLGSINNNNCYVC
jgi:ankyrin repeat protein